MLDFIAMQHLSPLELQSMLGRADLTLLDVRMPEEIEIASIPGALQIPMHEIPQRLGDLNQSSCIVVLCHHGVRSEQVARLLERSGFSDVSHLAGGIDRWADEIDPSMPRY